MEFSEYPVCLALLISLLICTIGLSPFFLSEQDVDMIGNVGGVLILSIVFLILKHRHVIVDKDTMTFMVKENNVFFRKKKLFNMSEFRQVRIGYGAGQRQHAGSLIFQFQNGQVTAIGADICIRHRKRLTSFMNEFTRWVS